MPACYGLLISLPHYKTIGRAEAGPVRSTSLGEWSKFEK
jgi:hypothetical protein